MECKAALEKILSIRGCFQHAGLRNCGTDFRTRAAF